MCTVKVKGIVIQRGHCISCVFSYFPAELHSAKMQIQVESKGSLNHQPSIFLSLQHACPCLKLAQVMSSNSCR